MRNDTYHCDGIAEYDRANAGELDGEAAEELTEEEREAGVLEAEEAYREASAEAADWVARGLWS